MGMLSNFFDALDLLWLLAFFLKYSNLLYIMSQDNLVLIKNKQTGEVYWTRKNRRKVERKIELKKFSKKLKKTVVFKEVKR